MLGLKLNHVSKRGPRNHRGIMDLGDVFKIVITATTLAEGCLTRNFSGLHW